MTEGFKAELVDAVKAATEVLNDEDVLKILEICKHAADREIAEATERYLEEAIREGESE